MVLADVRTVLTSDAQLSKLITESDLRISKSYDEKFRAKAHTPVVAVVKSKNSSTVRNRQEAISA
jgi:hypothetical protein